MQQTKIQFRGIRPGDENGRMGLRNPERGFRFEIGIGRCQLDPLKWSHLRDQWPFERYTDDGITVTQAYCYLTQFYDSPIAQYKLDALSADFAKARREGVKFLLRFAYEFECGEENAYGPAVEQILEHMKQLKPLLDRNWDIIYCLQIGWVGAWGEFHSSLHKLEQDLNVTSRIVQSTLELLPPDRSTMMRRAQYKIDNLKKLGCFEEVTGKTAHSMIPAARIGFFNDGTLANFWDGGTFTEPPFYSMPGNREFDFMSRESAYLPVDGELFWSGWNEAREPIGIRACERFRRHHYSTFSLVHSFSELDKPEKWSIDYWKETDLRTEHLELLKLPFSPDYFYGDVSRTAFEYIRDHLGYRLEAQELRVDKDSAAGGVTIELDLINRGFATLVNPREVYFVLVGTGGEIVEVPTGADCRNFQPFSPGDENYKPLTHTLKAYVSLPEGSAERTWDLCLWLPDTSESLRYRDDYAIRLANNTEWLAKKGYGLNRLASLQF